jgi:hypothetical protein
MHKLLGILITTLVRAFVLVAVVIVIIYWIGHP